MTTIACDGKSIAADSKTDMDGIPDTCRKLLRAKNGDILGFAGDTGSGMKFQKWYDSERVDSCDLGETCVLVLHPEGSMTLWDSTLFPMKVRRKFFAIGSGAQAAMAVMMSGGTARKAVEVACKLDASSGGPVVEMKPKRAKP